MSCIKEGLFDEHHIIPKYMGGSNDFTNLVKVSRTCHTMFHFCNYQLWGNKEDYLAYRGLSGQISKQDIIKEKSIISGKKCAEEKIGMFSFTKEQRIFASSKGGRKAGNYMSQSMWINNGTQNKRVLNTELIPDGWVKGKVKKVKSKKKSYPYKKKNTRTWEEYKETFADIDKQRLEYLKNVDLTKYGIITIISKDWNVSRTQVNRFLKKYNLK
jgi:HNH endonuclease